MSLNKVKRELKKLDKEKLIDLISDLYRKNKSAKEYFDFCINPDEYGLIEKYHDKIFEAFYPTRGNFNIKKAKSALSDFKKFETAKDYYAELLLFYVETGVNFTNDYGELDVGFYSG